eukprot:10040049-Ditylum_brightwellii.AAC.1
MAGELQSDYSQHSPYWLQSNYSKQFMLEDEVPNSLVREGDGPDGNYPMRSKLKKCAVKLKLQLHRSFPILMVK